MNGKYGRKRPYYGLDVPCVEVLESPVVLNLSDFTDNGDATGYVDIDNALPAGAVPLGWKIDTLIGFATTAVFTGNPLNLAFVDGDAGDDTLVSDEVDYSFIDDGFEEGDSFIVAGATTAENDGTYVITGVAAQTLTVATGSWTAEEDGVAGTTLTGVSTATVKVGVDGDLDRFSADTAKSVAAIGTVGSSVLSADACDGIGGDQTVRVTVSEGSDFGEFDVGALKFFLYYIKTA